MKVCDLMDAIGETNERFLEESERYSERPRIIRKWAVSAASLLLLTSLVLIPIKNGALGCGAASNEEHTHLFYQSLEDFTKDVGKDSLFANLSYEESEITDYRMECIYYPHGHYLAGYYCTYRLTDAPDVQISISFTDADIDLAEGEKIMLHGYDVVITLSDELRTKLDIYTDHGEYTVSVSGEGHADIAIQIAEDLLTQE